MEAVSDSLGKAFASLSGLFNTFINKILTPLIDGFVKLIGFITSAATFIADVFSPGLAEAAQRSGELAEALDDLNDAEAQSAISRAESNRKLQEARDLANDANVPIKDRIAALKEAAKIEKEEFDKSIQIATQRAKYMLEQIAIELGGRKDLIEAIRSGSVEQLKAARNELFALKSIDKEKIKAIDELIIKAEDEGAQRAKINKKTESQITSLEKEEQAKRKEAADKAREQRKAEEQKLAEFRTKLLQLQQDNELSSIKDGYQKELRQLEIKLENDKRLNEQAIKDRKITRQQADQLNVELDKQFNLKQTDVVDKHNKEIADKEIVFQEKLAKLKQEIALGGIVNARQLEQEQLNISRQAALDEAIKAYGNDAAKLAELRTAIDEKFRQDQAKIDEKNRKEDAQKKLDASLKSGDAVVNDPTAIYEAKKAALDAEQIAIDEAYTAKILSEEAYTEKVKDLTGKRMQIADAETAQKKAQVEAVSSLLGALGAIVGKQTIAGKALGVATALINTYQGASEALKQKSTLPSPFDVIAKVANVAAVIATGLATVKAITSVQVPASAAGGGGSSVSVPAAPIAPAQASTRIDQASIQGIGDATSGRAYVVSSDIEKDTNRNERLNRAARLGD
jgi:hypothetical protein